MENNRETNQQVTRSPQIKKSRTFSIDNDNYTIKPDRNGYVMMKMENGREKVYGKIRKMESRNSYILILPNDQKFGYFDKKGNFMVEEYDADSDSVKLKKYRIHKDDSGNRRR